MTSKTKAKELYELCYPHAFHPSPMFNTSDNGGHTKKLALICVKEIVEELKSLFDGGFLSTEATKYWKDVKKEIELL